MEKCELDYGPRQEAFESVHLPPNEPEMTEAESAFLCGLLNQTDVRSVVEVGVAGGGTSAIILQCMEQKKTGWKYYAVDCSERFYRDNSLRTGWIGSRAYEMSEHKGAFSLLLGNTLPFVIETICKDDPIDFILLDTVHKLPGELLDFLLVLPFLSKEAVVCLHDISLNLKSPLRISDNATNILFNSVVADKIINLDLESSDKKTYPNIGAFRINADTLKYIYNVFGMLSLNWAYIPTEIEIQKYRDIFSKHYDETCIEIFDRAYIINSNSKSTMPSRLRKATKIIVKGKM